jgi:hypothetical protein
MTYHPKFHPDGAAPAFLDPSSGGIEIHWRPASVPADARSAAAELRIAYARLARRFPDETFSPGLIMGGACAGKLRAGLLVALVAILVTIIARGIGVGPLVPS